MKFRKKPVVIEAFQMTFDRRDDKDNWPKWLQDAWWSTDSFETPNVIYYDHQAGVFKISTMEGKLKVSWDDWIIRGVNGELYPCKPDIFEATYEAVPD